MKPLLATCLTLLLGACAGNGSSWPFGDGYDAADFVPAQRLDAGAADAIVPAMAKADPSAPIPAERPLLRRIAPNQPRQPVSPLQALADAHEQAALSPAPEGFVGAHLVYPHVPGRIYEVHTAPGTHTTIELERGEVIQELVAGDTVTWLFSDTIGGAGAEARPLVFIKPIMPKARTNLTIVTTKRLYQLDLISHPVGAYTTQVSWRYPHQEFAQQTRQRPYQDDGTLSTKVALDTVAFDYRIETKRGDAPAWKPVHVFHDGQKTYIRFPATVPVRPPLFVVRGGDTEIVNYRTQGHYYVVDTVVDVAELRLGQKRQTVVRLTRQDQA